MTLCCSSSIAVAQQQQQQRPNFVSQSPFGYTGRISSVGFENQGFRNAGLTSVGFRNAGFQNVGFRNSAISNTGFQSGFNGSTRMAAYPNMNNQNFGNIGNYVPSFNQLAPNVPSVPASNPVAQQPVALDSSSLQSQSIYTPPFDDTAAISVGRSTNLTSGYRLPAISRGPRFTVGLGFDSPAGSIASMNPKLSQELQTQFANSQFFPAGNHITVSVENNVVILKGRVTDDHERELAEAVVRLSPGVYEVRNELLTGEITASNK
jgi:hypothetical protein